MKLMTTPYCLPLNITPEQFLAEYWQQKPLLIRQGLPALVGMFEPDDIIGLSLDPDVNARLLMQHKDNTNLKTTEQWQVKNSPLDELDFDNLPAQWTVLVQNLEQWSPELGKLWQAFDFLPTWQRDDIMVSFAPAGGSVGRHYDEYDVFLAQGYGSRRWQLGKLCDDDTEFLPNQPIRIMNDMGEIIFDEVLEAGDVLYVPPKLSHYGVAQDDCLTFSFGFRRPNLMQILDSLAEVATSDQSLFVPMQLPQAPQSSGELTEDSINHIKSQLLDSLQSKQGDDLFTKAISEVVSKRQYDLLMPEETLTLDELADLMESGAVIRIDHSSRLIYRQNGEKVVLYANGQALEDLNDAETVLLKRLADGEAITLKDLQTKFNNLASNALFESVMDWLENGWVWVDNLNE